MNSTERDGHRFLKMYTAASCKTVIITVLSILNPFNVHIDLTSQQLTTLTK